MKLHIFRIAFIALLLHFICGCRSNSEDIIPFAASLQEANVTLSQMQDGKSESLMLGNGDIYGIIWGLDSWTHFSLDWLLGEEQTLD
jgi:hypothetical protein